MPRRYSMPQDYAPYGQQSWGGAAMEGVGTFVSSFMEAYEKGMQRKKEEAGMILQFLTEYGGELTPEQIGELEKNITPNKRMQGMIRSTFEPVRENLPAFEEGEEEQPTVRQVAEGKIKGYRMPSKSERELKRKEKELAIEHPYKEEMKELDWKHKFAQQESNFKHQLDLIDERMKHYKDIAQGGYASKEKIAEQNNKIKELEIERDKIKDQMEDNRKRYEADLKAKTEEKKIKSREKIQEDKQAGKAVGKTDPKQLEKYKIFSDLLKKQGVMNPDGSFKAVNRRQADIIKGLAESNGYQYREVTDKHWYGTNIIPIVDTGFALPKPGEEAAPAAPAAPAKPSPEKPGAAPTAPKPGVKIQPPAQGKQLSDSEKMAIVKELVRKANDPQDPKNVDEMIERCKKLYNFDPTPYIKRGK